MLAVLGAVCLFSAPGATAAPDPTPTTAPVSSPTPAAPPDLAATAPATTAPSANARTKLTLDPYAARAGSELLLFQDMPVVISASRQAQPLNLSSVPVSVITADDIHYSARTTLPEILQFVPGMDVQKIDRGNYAVGVRGLHHSFADRTLTLINGRDAGSPLFGGTDFLALPILNEDIERIEVVRGPGGAAWGPNAFNGVINIITKKPEDVLGLMTSTTVDQYGDTYNQARWAAKRGDLSWRLSLGYEDIRSSNEVLNSSANVRITNPDVAPLLGGSTFEANDSVRNLRLDSEMVYKFSPETRLTIGLADSSSDRGVMEFSGYQPEDRTRVDLLRAFAKLDLAPDPDTTGYLQWFTNYDTIDYPALARGSGSESDLETQWTFAAVPDHKITAGGNLRLIQADFDPARPTDLLDTSACEYAAGMFVMDRWQLTKRFALEGQARGDWYSGTGADWSGRLTALYGLDEDNRHVLRLGVARAFREPLLGVRDINGARLPLPAPAPPGFDALNFLPNGSLGNEHVTSVEAGYNGQLTDHLTLRLDGYFQRYSGLIGGAELPDPLGMGREFVQLENIAGGDAPGAEVEVAYALKACRLSLWYAYNSFSADQSAQNTRSFLPIPHQAGLNSRWAIGAGWTFNSNFKFSGAPDDVTNQLDLSVGKSLFDNHAEIIAGIADLFDTTRRGISEDGQFTTHDTPGRTFFLRLVMKF